MNEAETRAKYIDPMLKVSGWGEVDESKILREFRITEGKIQIGGGAQPNISQNIVRKLSVPVPDIATQKQIVAKLDTVQQYKKQLMEQRQKLKELFDSMLRKSFKND